MLRPRGERRSQSWSQVVVGCCSGCCFSNELLPPFFSHFCSKKTSEKKGEKPLRFYWDASIGSPKGERWWKSKNMGWWVDLGGIWEWWPLNIPQLFLLHLVFLHVFSCFPWLFHVCFTSFSPPPVVFVAQEEGSMSFSVALLSGALHDAWALRFSTERRGENRWLARFGEGFLGWLDLPVGGVLGGFTLKLKQGFSQSPGDHPGFDL